MGCFKGSDLTLSVLPPKTLPEAAQAGSATHYLAENSSCPPSGGPSPSWPPQAASVSGGGAGFRVAKRGGFFSVATGVGFCQKRFGRFSCAGLVKSTSGELSNGTAF